MVLAGVLVVALLLVAGPLYSEAQGPCASTGQTPYDYKQALCMSVLFYEAQRSGALPSDQRLSWRWDSALTDGQDSGVDLSGGYYDAGDFVKFGFPMASSVTVIAWGLLSYRSGYQTAGQEGYAEAAIRWGTDYFLKAHSAGMTLYGQVGQGDIDHAYWGRPEEMTMYRPSWKIDTSAPGAELAAETASALATAYMVFKDSDSSYASRCLDAAKDLFELADQHRGYYHESIPDAALYYRSFSGWGDELSMAAVFLYQATGDSYYSNKAFTYWDEFGVQWSASGFGWDNKFSGAQILFAEVFGGEPYLSAVKSFMEGMRSSPHTPGGMVYLGEWGSLRSAINVAFIAFKAADLGVDTDVNRAWAAQQVNYALGSVGHSYVVGFGVNPPQRPHHRSSSCPDYPGSCTDGWAINQEGPNPQVLYGALVGGPDQNDGYVDDRLDYVHNEVACDYNAALTGALAAMVQYN